MSNYRIYVEKKDNFGVESKSLLNEFNLNLGLNLISLRYLNVYDLFNFSTELLEKTKYSVFGEKVTDNVYLDLDLNNKKYLAVEYLPGQFDQRASSAIDCVKLLEPDCNINIRSGKLIIFDDEITTQELEKIEKYYINAVEARKKDLSVLTDLEKAVTKAVVILEGFRQIKDYNAFCKTYGLAMSSEDLECVVKYFNEEGRDPYETELRILDTYWSDHCRHTTFNTAIEEVKIDESFIKTELEEAYDLYLKIRKDLNRENKTLCLMDLACIGARYLKKIGKLDDLEESEENNACSIYVNVDVDGKDEKWLLQFKNETHNHPTEIEPFGGASTCLGGAIRDPLSGRAYVYQAMRVTGARNIYLDVKDTIKGKLPQKIISTKAASGYSSYGNQIGLATTHVREIYHDDYVAKRLEVGAVVGAVKAEAVRRESPTPGDIVLLLGGRTGRDGIGGATGSSKSHELKTTTSAGAEVQKGNPVEERKIQRLFRNKEVSEKVIRCNDFGAGGVCVAVGELAPGLEIELDNVLKKYEGLNGTELAISESQERMAIVIEPKDEEFIKNACKLENLEVVRVATVTDNNRLVMRYLGQTIVDIDRAFLDKNGAKRYQKVEIETPDFNHTPFDQEEANSFVETSKEVLSRLSVCGQKGLVEMFDSSFGNNTDISPFGGKTYQTEAEGMAALIPVLVKETTTCSLMSYGFNPNISKWSPYHGAMMGIVESVAKIVAMGGNYHNIRFSFQEYFEKLLTNPTKWGKPFAALLGAYRVQSELKLPSIGGKDSMSGTFEELNVPPTLVSFAITTADTKEVLTPELKGSNHTLVEVMLPKDQYHVYDFKALVSQYDMVMDLIRNGKVYSAYTVKDGGVIEAIYKMAFGNQIGVRLNSELQLSSLVEKNYGNLILEIDNDTVIPSKDIRVIGHTIAEKKVLYNDEQFELTEAYQIYEGILDGVYATKAKAPTEEIIIKDCNERSKLHADKYYDEVNVVIPVFPGTNCEYDSKRAFERAGAKVNLVLIRNKTEEDIKNSINDLTEAIYKSQIMMIPGGFSAGDEPEGSGKFIATFLRNAKIKEAITDLLDNREGLMIGICNGFQALIKLGLLPYGKIKDMNDSDPTLTFNTIGRHVSQMVETRIASVKSPWLANVNVGDIHTIPVSHGEGRFVAPKEVIENLFDNGQVFSQYVDMNDTPTMESPYNPNGSMMAIEGIVSLDGRVLGKMGHSERQGEGRNKNIYGKMDQMLFESGVKYFKK